MPKRKRSETEDIIDKIADRAIRIKASRLSVKIDHGNKSLKAALNLARGFERQKLGRRQKQASNEPHSLLRLREEVIVLKELDITKIASDYLFKQLARTKRIRESPAFVALYGHDPKTEAPKNNAEANVLGRLFKTNAVKEVLPGIMEGIKQVLSIDGTKSVKRNQQLDEEPADVGMKHGHEALPTTDAEDFEGFSDEASAKDANVTASLYDDEDMEEAAIQAYSDRLAMFSGEDSDPNNEHDASSDGGLDPMEISDVDSEDQDIQGSVSSSQGRLSDTDATAKPKPKPKPTVDSEAVKVTNRATSTAFLPSLSMGGYYSGSDSASEAEDPFYDQDRGPAIAKERKNRRGQRERQKLAELKFGKNAKHLQNQQKNKDTRSSGWDAKRGAVDNAGYNPRRRQFGRSSFGRNTGPTGANGETMVGNRTTRAAKPATKKNEPSLHPSWEAAKKRKQETGKVAFAGKKITFD